MIPDVEGSWSRFASTFYLNPLAELVGENILLKNGTTLVVLGDLIDRGPNSRRILRVVNSAVSSYPGRVLTLGGNRDINKWALTGMDPDSVAPTLQHELGAPEAFEFRRTELSEELHKDVSTITDNQVAASFIEDLKPNGSLRTYLFSSRVVHRIGESLFVHGSITNENFGRVPFNKHLFFSNLDNWVREMNAWYRKKNRELSTGLWERQGRVGHALIDYQRPLRGTHSNPLSVIYGRLQTDLMSGYHPIAPHSQVCRWLRSNGIRYVFFGHTPQGNMATTLPTSEEVTFLGLDTSYSQDETSSYALVTEEEVEIRKQMKLKGATGLLIAHPLEIGSPVGSITSTGLMIKGVFGDGSYYAEKRPSIHSIAYRVFPSAELANLELSRMGEQGPSRFCGGLVSSGSQRR